MTFLSLWYPTGSFIFVRIICHYIFFCCNIFKISTFS